MFIRCQVLGQGLLICLFICTYLNHTRTNRITRKLPLTIVRSVEIWFTSRKVI